MLDGADLALKGIMEAGFAGMMLAVPDKHRFYVATTFYERLTRGKRTDVIQVFEPFPSYLLADKAGYVWYEAAKRGPKPAALAKGRAGKRPAKAKKAR